MIWNDYDNFSLRLSNIEATNRLLLDLRKTLSGDQNKKRIEEPLRSKVLNIVRNHEDKYGYVDYVTLSSQVLFSGKYKTDYDGISSETMYNRIKLSDYDASGYLEGVEVVRDDYKKIYKQYKHTKNIVWLIDPPYLSTDTTSYSKTDYWRLRDYLDVLNLLDGSSYFYFTSNKSQIIELCDWIETRTLSGNPFSNSTMNTTAGNVNFGSSYTDIMIYKKV